MVFKRLLGSIGVGGPAVDTVLTPHTLLPGGELAGEVRLRGGGSDVTVEHITLELIARVEAEGESEYGGHDEGSESEATVVFERYTVGGGFRLAENEQLTVPFSVRLPWQTPVTELYGQPLGIVLGVRTELGVAGGRDRGDLDPLTVGPLPVQEAVLEALGQLGFFFASADLEYGLIGGSRQQLPFYQEIEITPPARYAHAVREIEVTFLAGADGVDVVLEADKRGGPAFGDPVFGDGHDAFALFTVDHDSVGRTDWNTVVDQWVRQLVEQHPAYIAGPVNGHGHGHESGHGHGGHDGHGHGGHGTGAVVAAGAAGLAVGVVGGLVAAEVVDEVGDFFEGEEGEEEG